MWADLHNHTTMCHHATGSVDDYIQKAIAEGITHLGFSEHAPMHFDPKYRLAFEELEPYEQLIGEAKTRYKDQISVLLGYEVDYLPRYEDRRIFSREVDYLIGSVHFIDEWGFDNPEFIGHYNSIDIDRTWERYFALIEAMAHSGRYDIVGHFDLLKVFNHRPKKDIRQLAQKALKAIKAADMVLEVNVAGVRKPVGELYPGTDILQEAFALDIPICFGSDAHAPEQIGLYKEEAAAAARAIGYTKAAVFIARDRELFKI